jgi:FKBP-type peptidyl-prolyl cis-trans isomerase 2
VVGILNYLSVTKSATIVTFMGNHNLVGKTLVNTVELVEVIVDYGASLNLQVLC